MDKTLIETIKKMEKCSELGYEVYFEGQGNGKVKAIAEAIFIVNQEKRNKREKLPTT
jgi:predicted subunit of tRNA(5-methylaminomethyl-2-thiouridylate) methyltransferase